MKEDLSNFERSRSDLGLYYLIPTNILYINIEDGDYLWVFHSFYKLLSSYYSIRHLKFESNQRKLIFSKLTWA